MENDQENSVALVNISEKMPFFVENDLKTRMTAPNHTIGRINFGRNQTYHVLQPLNVGDNFYYQIVNETIKSLNEKEIVVITHDENGKILARDIIKGDFGDKYTTKI